MDVQNIEDLDKIVKKIGWKKTLFYLFVLLVLFGITTAISSYFGVKTYYENKIEQKVTTNTNVTTTVSSADNKKESKSAPDQIAKNRGEELGAQVGEFKEDDWEINDKRIYKEKDKDGNLTGFYCVYDSKAFDSAEIWYKNKIATKTSVTIRYFLKSIDKDTEPRLIFSYGEDRDFRMFTPGTDKRYIEFEEKENRKRQNKKLTDEIDLTKANEIQINIGSSPPNQANIGFILKYLSLGDREGRESTFSDSFTARFPWPNPDSEGAKQKIGFGVFNGNCLKPTYFKPI